MGSIFRLSGFKLLKPKKNCKHLLDTLIPKTPEEVWQPVFVARQQGQYHRVNHDAEDAFSRHVWTDKKQKEKITFKNIMKQF